MSEDVSKNKVDTKAKGLFNWVDVEFYVSVDHPDPNFRSIKTEECRWCGNYTKITQEEEYKVTSHYADFTTFGWVRQCFVCGWYLEFRSLVHCQPIQDARWGYYPVMFNCQTNDLLQSIPELCSFLKRRFSDIYSLPPRTLEQIVNDVFRQNGFRTTLTQQTRDQGVDILVLEGDNEIKAIVQVKRYAKHRKVGIELVRQLVGAEILHFPQVPKCVLVTTSSFTRDAQQCQPPAGLELELWDGLRLLRELAVYNEEGLSLDRIKPSIPLRDQFPKNFHAQPRILKKDWTHCPMPMSCSG